MKRNIITFVILVLIIALGYNADLKKKNKEIFTTHLSSLQDVDINSDDGTIVLVFDDYDDLELKITDKYELFVNGEEIELNKEQQVLVKEYYDGLITILENAKVIGLDGARVGVSGIKVGLKAVAGVFKLLSPEYDSDDLEAEIEKATEQIEKQAAELEKRAAELEKRADDFEKIHLLLIENIPELNKLK